MKYSLVEKLFVGGVVFGIAVCAVPLYLYAIGFRGHATSISTSNPSRPVPWSEQRARQYQAIDTFENVIQAMGLKQIDGAIGNCTSFRVYDLGGDSVLVINTNACFEMGVYIKSKSK